MFRRGTIFIASFITAVVLSQASCITTPVSMALSTTPLHEKSVAQNLGKTRGTHTTWSVLGLWMIGRPDIDRAIADALQKKGGDALINVRCYEETTWFILFSLNKVIIEGEAVTLQNMKQK